MFGENGFIEALIALIFVVTALIAIYQTFISARKFIPSVISIIGIVCYLEEISYGKNIFGWKNIELLGRDVDLAHDFLSIAHEHIEGYGYFGIGLLLMALVLIILISAAVFAKIVKEPNGPSVLSAEFIFLFICAFFIVAASTLDLEIFPGEDDSSLSASLALEESLELAAAWALLGSLLLFRLRPENDSSDLKRAAGRGAPFAFPVVILLSVGFGVAAGYASLDGNLFRRTERAFLLEQNSDAGSPVTGTVDWVLLDAQSARATIVIPSRDFSIVMTITFNSDESIPATHLINITPAGAPLSVDRVVASLATPMMRTKGYRRQLAGIFFDLGDDAYWIALPTSERERAHNLRMLSEWSFFELPFQDWSGGRGSVVFERGESGERVLKELLDHESSLDRPESASSKSG